MQNLTPSPTQYKLGTAWLGSSSAGKGMGLLADSKLSGSLQHALCIQQGSRQQVKGRNCPPILSPHEITSGIQSPVWGPLSLKRCWHNAETSRQTLYKWNTRLTTGLREPGMHCLGNRKLKGKSSHFLLLLQRAAVLQKMNQDSEVYRERTRGNGCELQHKKFLVKHDFFSQQ